MVRQGDIVDGVTRQQLARCDGRFDAHSDLVADFHRIPPKNVRILFDSKNIKIGYKYT
jgi:hypothetical protein